MDTPTRQLVERYLPQVKNLRDGLEGSASGYSTLKAKAMLGFESRCSLLD